MRMAAVSQEAAPSDLLPLFARNVVVHGYEELKSKQRGGRPTEYLILVERYLRQARELQALAGAEGVIRVSECSQAKPLLDALGYRLRQPCGPNTSVETADPDRAFLTIDSGFPLAQLEQSLRGGKPFAYPYAPSKVPLLFTPDDWTSNAFDPRAAKGEVIDALVRDPALARLYWAMSRLDTQTRNDLNQSVGIRNLIPFAGPLDYYGSEICIRAGRVLVPGGPSSDSAWRGLVGASPDQPAKFVVRLLEKDNGWLAAYFDALSRIPRSRQGYFTQAGRLKTFYQALRGDDLSPNPARPAFRPDPGLFLLVTRLQLDPNGQPHVPGGLEVWKEALQQKSDSKIVRDWAGRARGWKRPDQLLAGMFAFSRVPTQDGPLQMYLMLGEIDRGRSAADRLSPQAARLLLEKFSRFNNQYLLFSEFHGLNNAAIIRFLNVAQDLDHIADATLRTNAVGAFQAEVGLWQILARQGEIPSPAFSDSFDRVIAPFALIRSSAQLFDSGRASFEQLCRAATGRTGLSQDEFIALLAGPNSSDPESAQVRQEMASRVRAVMDDQRLIPLDTLFALGTGLNEMAQGKAKADGLLPLAAELHQFEMPRPIFTSSERTDWSSGLYDNRHTAAQMHTDLTRILETPRSPKELLDARGLLAPFLRDSLVGLNYAYNEPPGAEMLHNDPLFVRTHDFSGAIALGGGESWQTPFLLGRGWTAGGGAHLAGSLADLPYVLAEVEQDFIVPENVQSLIWEDMVPTLITSAVLPRWWGVSRNELHAVTLYQRAGEELLAASARDRALRDTVMDILSDRMLPDRLEMIGDALGSGRLKDVLAQTTPADTFYLTAEFRRRFPQEAGNRGPAGKELDALCRRHPAETAMARLSRDFGVPHPALALTYSPQLLSVKPVPTFMGYSSRLLAESWDSTNLYWARLADEMGYTPVMLNILAPELTRRMVGKIFATHPEDWPAVLRAMRETGEEFRRGEIASLPKPNAASPPVAMMPQ
ncbi:MAG TPA: hypothetical protein VGS20_16020 [Candidatus Acidoferrales bacterium]|nr:hypothetical protein [Candidatus Acidoferrales bacterium]